MNEAIPPRKEGLDQKPQGLCRYRDTDTGGADTAEKTSSSPSCSWILERSSSGQESCNPTDHRRPKAGSAEGQAEAGKAAGGWEALLNSFEGCVQNWIRY